MRKFLILRTMAGRQCQFWKHIGISNSNSCIGGDNGLFCLAYIRSTLQ